jgi:hypothetical protein
MTANSKLSKFNPLRPAIHESIKPFHSYHYPRYHKYESSNMFKVGSAGVQARISKMYEHVDAHESLDEYAEVLEGSWLEEPFLLSSYKVPSYIMSSYNSIKGNRLFSPRQFFALVIPPGARWFAALQHFEQPSSTSLGIDGTSVPRHICPYVPRM